MNIPRIRDTRLFINIFSNGAFNKYAQSSAGKTAKIGFIISFFISKLIFVAKISWRILRDEVIIFDTIIIKTNARIPKPGTKIVISVIRTAELYKL